MNGVVTGGLMWMLAGVILLRTRRVSGAVGSML
jgi:hypothetical protein